MGYEEIIVEALDDEEMLGISDLFEDFQYSETVSITTRTHRKQTLVELSKKPTHEKEKIHCNECGIFLSTCISLKRHVDRVS